MSSTERELAALKSKLEPAFDWKLWIGLRFRVVIINGEILQHLRTVRVRVLIHALHDMQGIIR